MHPLFIERQNSGSSYQVIDDDIPKDGFNYGMAFFYLLK